MDGIVTGKVIEGAIYFNSAIHKDMVTGDKSLEIETINTSLDYFKLMMTDNSILIGRMESFYNVTFAAGSFTGTNAVEFTFRTFDHDLRAFSVHSVNYNYSISNAFKYLELGTLS